MVWVYAVALIVGFVALLVWIGATAVATWVDGWEFADPEQRFGARGRFAVAGTIGFGMAGMSATFAGLHPAVAVGAAIAGAAFLVWLANTFAPVRA